MLLVIVFILVLFAIFSIKLKLIIIVKDYKHFICLDVYVLKKIKVYRFTFNNYKKKNIKKEKKQKYNKIFSEIIKKGKYQLDKFYLKVDICTTDPILTAYSVAALSSFIGIGIKLSKANIKSKNFHFKVSPIYESKKILNIKLKCIISISLVHIITVFLCTRKY